MLFLRFSLPQSDGSMSGNARILVPIGALALFVATVLGAYGTHGVQGTVDARSWSAYQVAVQYQFFHGLGIIAAAIVADRFPRSRWIALSGWILLFGVVAFCGSIYATTLGAPQRIGVLAPIGGVGLMAGWLSLAIGVMRAG